MQEALLTVPGITMMVCAGVGLVTVFWILGKGNKH